MASRISLPQFPRLPVSFDRKHTGARLREAAEWRPPRGKALTLLLYRLVWSPFWVSSDVPAPQLPSRDAVLPPGGPAGDHVAKNIARVQRRLWIQRSISILFRLLWLPILAGCFWMIFELGGGPEVHFYWLIWFGLVLLIPAVVFAFLARPSRLQVARMLDKSFVLQDRLMTAVGNIGSGVPIDGARAEVRYLQMADAANVMTDLRGHPAFAIRPPIREVVLGIACALMLAALFFMRGVGGDVPFPAVDAVPAFTPAAERLALQPEPAPQVESAMADAPTTAEVQARSDKSRQAQQDLNALGDALADQAVTRSVADAIQRGDYAAAADELRDISENAAQWSESAREGLADDLDQAADNMSPGSEGLANAAREAADGLREGGEPAQEGVANLGDAVDQTASNIVSNQELSEQMRQAEAAAEARGDSGEQSNDSGQSGDSSSAESGASSDPSGQAGESSASNAEGSDAAPGEASGDQSGESSGEGGENGSNQSVANDPRAAARDAQSQAGESASGSGAAAADPGEGGLPGQSQGSESSPSDQEGASDDGGHAGPGASAGNSESDGAAGEGQPGEDGQPGEGEASDPNITEADPSGAAGDEAETDARASVTLSRSPEGEAIQTGGNGGSSSLGSGSGAAMSGGDSVQGEVGTAGPDSNHVPSEYRGIVEDYFSDPDGS